jgi:hypothetical protein
VAPDIDAAGVEAARLELERRLNALEQQALSMLGPSRAPRAQAAGGKR